MLRILVPVVLVTLVLIAGMSQAAVVNVPSLGITTIQDGIDAAAANDTVLVAPGTYNESIVITTPLTLESSGGPAVTTIDGNSTTENYYMVNIGADDVVINGFTITNPIFNGTADASGVVIGSLSTNSNIRVTNCIIHDIGSPARSGVSFGTFGVNCGPVDGLEIDNNTIYNIQDAGNDFADVGMFVYGNSAIDPATNISIHDNVVYNVGSPGLFDTGIYVGSDSLSITVQANTVYSNTTTSLQTGEYAIATGRNGLGPISLIGNYVGAANLGGIRLRNSFTDTVYGNNAYANVTGILLTNTSVGAAITYNNIWGNTTYGLQNLATAISAPHNWWGDASGPSGIGPGTGDAIAGLVTFTPFLTTPTGRMNLGAGATIYASPGQPVTISLNQAGLVTPRTGFQAFLTFDPAKLSFSTATYTSSPYGVPTPVASGTDSVVLGAVATIPQGSTTRDAKLADIVFTAGATEGPTVVSFSTFTPPTRLLDAAGLAILPLTTDGTIYIDGTPPIITITSAKQGIVELIGGPTAGIGPVSIKVTASDAGSGLAGHPAVTVTPNGGSPQTATFVNESPAGTFNYTWSNTTITPGGPTVINASVSDNVGNTANAAPKTISVAEAHATVRVQIEGAVTGPIVRVIQFVFGGSSAPQFIVNRTMTFLNGLSVANIDGLPGAALFTCVSAKDVQHTLFSRGTLVRVDATHYTGNLTAGLKLRGGDINNNNVADVYDFGILAAQYGSTGHPYTFPALDADISGNGKVGKEDYNILYGHYRQQGTPPCNATVGQLPTPILRISVSQLAPLVGGLTNARKADLSGDSFVDWIDFRLFLYTKK